jgi:limonene-1,2-epoxide hydrolase
VYHNIPLDPVVGVDDTVTFIDRFFGMCQALVIEEVNVAVCGNVVLTERIDTFTVAGTTTPLPVTGTFEIVDGKVAAWRDYFDTGQITSAFAGGE